MPSPGPTPSAPQPETPAQASAAHALAFAGSGEAPAPLWSLGTLTPTARHGRSPWVLQAAGCQPPWVCLPSTVQSPRMTLAEQPWAGAKPQPWSIPWPRISPGLGPGAGAGSGSATHTDGDGDAGCGTPRPQGWCCCSWSSRARLPLPTGARCQGGPNVPVPPLPGPIGRAASAGASQAGGDGRRQERTGRAAGRGHSWSRCSLAAPRGPVSAFNEWEWERALYSNSSNYIVHPWQPTPAGVQRHGITIRHLARRAGSAPCHRAAGQGWAIKGCGARCEVR